MSIINENYASSCASKEGEDMELAEFIISRIVQTLFGQKAKDTAVWREKHEPRTL